MMILSGFLQKRKIYKKNNLKSIIFQKMFQHDYFLEKEFKKILDIFSWNWFKKLDLNVQSKKRVEKSSDLRHGLT